MKVNFRDFRLKVGPLGCPETSVRHNRSSLCNNPEVRSSKSEFSFTYWIKSSWNVKAHCDAREAKWKGNWGMEWVASTLHATSEHGVSSITTADAHTWAASSRLNWRPRRFKWTRPFRRKTKSGFCACAITFQMQFTKMLHSLLCWCGQQSSCDVVTYLCPRWWCR
jgi:hypothetical protein